jgi:hypothetical protein
MERNEGPGGLVHAYRRARWRWIAAAWGAIFAFDATRRWFDAYLDGRPLPLRLVAVAGASLALWAAVTPFMLWLGQRAPLDREHGARSVAIHVAASLVIVLGDAALQAWLWGDRDRSSVWSIFFAVLIVDGFSYATVIAIGHVQRTNALYRERVRAEAALAQELTVARLRALEMQLQPHFLFNSLHAVGALVRSGRPDDAVRGLATLGGLLRATLAGGDQHEIALGDEIALAHRYLQLQKIRFAERLQVSVEVAPEAWRARVPRLLLQPLLENAVRHGVEHSRSPVTVEVLARPRGDRLELIVRDHGGVREARSPGQGIGLANTRARLATLYGKGHGLELSPTEGGGLAIRIEIPLVLGPAGAPAPLELEGELRDEGGAAS